MSMLKDRLPGSKKELTPKMKALAGFTLSALGIAVGVLCIVPIHEGFGNLWTMLCAVIAGIFYTRYLKYRREDRTKT